MDSLVSAEWLAAHLADPDIVVVDCRITMNEQGPAPAHSAYSAAHVPGAVFADLVNDLSDTTQPIGFAVPTPAAFCEAMGRLGVGDNTRVVLYDDRMELPGMTFSSIWAARVWWMLRWVGFDHAALLDGGFGAWRDGGHPLSSGVEIATAATLTRQTRPQLIVDQDDVRAALEHPDITLVDTLTPASYDGSSPMYARPGHITGAINLPVFDLYDTDGRFLPDDEIARRHAAVDGRRTITYCGGGIAASATAFALTRIGHPDVAVYTASLQEWAADPDNPMATNPAPHDH
ncbi:3-mercaptopyruvate sulfurtransferase [soil metagenome]